jgi:hypothetical protein
MQMANASQSDIGLAGLVVRCGETSVDVLIVLLKPFPPRTHPRVKLATRDSTAEVQATVLSPGVVISLPREAAALVHGPWQSSREVAVEVGEDNDLIRGVISLVGARTCSSASRVELPVAMNAGLRIGLVATRRPVLIKREAAAKSIFAASSHWSS